MVSVPYSKPNASSANGKVDRKAFKAVCTAVLPVKEMDVFTQRHASTGKIRLPYKCKSLTPLLHSGFILRLRREGLMQHRPAFTSRPRYQIELLLTDGTL